MSIERTNFNTPLLFLIFNRPQFTRRVFEEIRRARPPKLFVAADGPRADHPGEDDLCSQARKAIRVDWDCDLHLDYRQKNQGLKLGVSGAIDWFFDHVEEGIILEDDCLPSPSFFDFCQELLTRYRKDDRVMHISGTNLQFGRKRGDGSYYFSRYMRCWGWASWRRAWAFYDVGMSTYEAFRRQNQLAHIVESRSMRRFWRLTFDAVAAGRISTWDFQWAYAIFAQGGLCAVPNVNLVSNLGFGPAATHTFDSKSVMANVQARDLEAITHPTLVLPDREADRFEGKHVFLLPLRQRALNRLKLLLGMARRQS